MLIKLTEMKQVAGEWITSGDKLINTMNIVLVSEWDEFVRAIFLCQTSNVSLYVRETLQEIQTKEWDQLIGG
jgi:hypothetical protein